MRVKFRMYHLIKSWYNWQEKSFRSSQEVSRPRDRSYIMEGIDYIRITVVLVR